MSGGVPLVPHKMLVRGRGVLPHFVDCDEETVSLGRREHRTNRGGGAGLDRGFRAGEGHGHKDQRPSARGRSPPHIASWPSRTTTLPSASTVARGSTMNQPPADVVLA